jgi:hypothetical protein
LMNDYSTEIINASYVGVDVDTFRKWTHLWISAISHLSTNVIKSEESVISLHLLSTSQEFCPQDVLSKH